MLFFEFFPLVLAIVSAGVCLWLVMADRRARGNAHEQGIHKVPPPQKGQPGSDQIGRGRPSMR